MDHADRHALPDRYRQDRDLTLRDEQQLDAPRGRESSFDDRSTHFEQGSSADGAFRGRIYRKPSSSLTEDSTGQGVSGQDAKYGTSFSSGEYGAENGRYPYKHGPLSIPYTTPASQFLYGTSVVTAALRSSKRQLYKLYVYDSENREVLARDQSIRKLALLRDVAVTRLKEDGLSLLDKLSRGRPHNGYILEASPLPKLPVRDFQPVRGHQGVFHATLNHQSSEEEKVNGTESEVKYQSVFPRYPLVLMLDGILDPGNLGGILRTAYFFGVDAIAISNRNCAPFSPVTLKASAGAAENLNLMSIAQPRSFIDESQRNGWKFYAAVAPSSSTRSGGRRVTHFTTSTLACPVRDHPCVLMVGGEGEGLSWDLQKKADFVLGVEGNRIRPSGVDSLNVSVATGLLCEAFLRRPVPVHVDKKSSGTDKDSAGTDNADGGQRLF
ncbi:rna family [Lasallia pustulata]|uniref:rRNA methyltransferase 1, mitochondrial n=1 Tax=Lasallia pustulata TaxID=136370 RepID=A0A1W5CZG5_9LECA|nr:rna family [Lasallia pustulata]